MKLTYKINLVILAILVIVGLAITFAGVNTIRQATYSLNSKLMSEEVKSISAKCRYSHGILMDNQLDGVESYVRQAQSEILAELEDYSYGNTGKLFIVSDKGLVIRHDVLSAGKMIDIDNITEIAGSKEGIQTLYYNGIERVFSYTYFADWKWIILLSVTSEEIYTAQKEFVSRVVLILLICLFLGAVLIVLFIQRVVDPILQLAQAATHVSEGRWDAALPEPRGRDEVARLTRSFRRMSESLAKMYGEMEDNLAKVEKSEAALKKSESELLRAQNYITAILNNVADPIFVKDEQHRWVLLNDAICDFMGYPREQLLGKSDYDFFPKEEADEFWAKDDLVFKTEKPNENEESFTDASGKQHIILTKKAVFRSAEGKKLLVGTIKDITERKLMEAELLKTQKLKSISILAGGIAHDFNNILTAILGNVSLLKEMVDKDGPLYPRLLETENASKKAKDLTHQLLTFSHGGAPVKETVSLTNLIEGSVSFTLSGTKVRADLSLSDDTWAVEVDESQISRAIHNLVVNAMQAMPKGGILKVDTANIKSENLSSLPLQKGRYVCVTFEDNGAGIPEERLALIFDPYYTTKEDGSGLGLAIVYSVVQRHGGHIAVTSQEGKGSCFKVYLPASDRDAVNGAEEVEEMEGGSGSILIMDDEEIVRETVSAMLNHLGYHTECAADGSEAISMYKKKRESGIPYDAVIMDLTIPGGMGGQEAIKELLQLDPQVKALVSSGYSQDPIMANFEQYGFLGVITKPFELQKVAAVLKAVLKNV